MKKILIAVDNDALLEQVKRCGKYMVHAHDLETKEDVIEYLSKYDVDVLVTKDTLNGKFTKEEYIKELRKINNELKIVYCVEELDEIYKGFLFANNVFEILEGTEIKFSNVLELIEAKDKTVILKKEGKVKSENINKSKLNLMTKKKVCVFGTSGAGKSYVASVIAQITSKKLKLNTLLIDMDIQNAAIDIYNNLTNSGNNLEYVMEEIDRGTFTNQMLQEIISKEKKKNGKLSFITNNMGIYECQNKMSKEYYEKLYDEGTNKYDVLVLDMPNAPFIDVVPYSLTKADKIFFVINPNFISIRQGLKYLDLLTNIWHITKENIYIVVNKVRKGSLDIKQVKALLKDYKICMSIPEDNVVEEIINGLKELDLNLVDKVDNIEELSEAFVDNEDLIEFAKSRLGVSHDN